MDNARVYEGDGGGGRKLCGFLSLVHRKQGRAEEKGLVWL